MSTHRVNTINEYTPGAGVTVGGVLLKTAKITATALIFATAQFVEAGGVVKARNLADNADMPIAAGAATFSGAVTLSSTLTVTGIINANAQEALKGARADTLATTILRFTNSGTGSDIILGTQNSAGNDPFSGIEGGGGFIGTPANKDFAILTNGIVRATFAKTGAVTLSGKTTVDAGVATQSEILIGHITGTAQGQLLTFGVGTGQYNWQLNTANPAQLDFLPSTATGGGTFSTPIITLNNSSGTPKIGFFNTAAVAKGAAILDADGTLADVTTKFNTLKNKLKDFGLFAT